MILEIVKEEVTMEEELKSKITMLCKFHNLKPIFKNWNKIINEGIKIEDVLMQLAERTEIDFDTLGLAVETIGESF